MTIPYTDADQIASYLGVTFTSAQATQAGTAAIAASAWIDRYTGRSWQAVSPITGEVHSALGDRVYLDHRPVLTITSVETRSHYIGAGYTLLAASQYELLDGAAGYLSVVGWGDYLVRVAYTHAGAAPPADIELATTMLAASWMSQTLRPSTSGLEAISVGQNDVALKFSASRSDVPAEALSILLGYRTPVIA